MVFAISKNLPSAATFIRGGRREEYKEARYRIALAIRFGSPGLASFPRAFGNLGQPMPSWSERSSRIDTGENSSIDMANEEQAAS